MTNLKIMETTGETVKNHPKAVVVIKLLITVLNILPGSKIGIPGVST